MKQEYVAGFLFSREWDKVALIEKQKPDWQKGFLNAIGGKIEKGEEPYEAMIREFKEETGVKITSWRNYCCLEGEDWRVYFYVAFGYLEALTSTTEEKVVIVASDLSDSPKTIPNLKWLVPMALQNDTYSQVTYL